MERDSNTNYTAPVTPLSAVLITRDEERRLPAALDSLRFCEDTVVVDCGSTDRTREVAAAAGARVVVNAPWPGFVVQRNFALGQARHDWVLFLDADERVPAALRSEIEALRSAGFVRDGAAHAGYRMPRVAYYLGRWIRGTDWYPDLQLRLFDRRQGQWEGGLVHESVRVRGSVGRLAGEIEHHPYADIADHLRTIDAYTSLWARQSHSAGRRTGGVEMAGAAAWAFFRSYVLRRGFLLGEAGLTVSALAALYTFVKLAKLQELHRQARRVA
jgi:glycosyltransferase involved in cell wall biosynthesis